MDVGWQGAVLLWFFFLWPAILVVIAKMRAKKRDATLNAILALVVSYGVYFIFSYLPTVPLHVMGVEEFLVATEGSYLRYFRVLMFPAAMIAATALIVFLFRKLEKPRDSQT